MSSLISKSLNCKKHQSWFQPVKCQELSCLHVIGLSRISAHLETGSLSWVFLVSQRSNREVLMQIQISKSKIMFSEATSKLWASSLRCRAMDFKARWDSQCLISQRKTKRNLRAWERTLKSMRSSPRALRLLFSGIQISKKPSHAFSLEVAQKDYLMAWDLEAILMCCFWETHLLQSLSSWNLWTDVHLSLSIQAVKVVQLLVWQLQ